MIRAGGLQVDQALIGGQSRIAAAIAQVDGDALQQRAIVFDVLGQQRCIRRLARCLESSHDRLVGRLAPPLFAAVLYEIGAGVENQGDYVRVLEYDLSPVSLDRSALVAHEHLGLVVQGDLVGPVALVRVARQGADGCQAVLLGA